MPPVLPRPGDSNRVTKQSSTHLLYLETAEGPRGLILVPSSLEIVTSPRNGPVTQIRPIRICAWYLVSGYQKRAALSSLWSPRWFQVLMPLPCLPPEEFLSKGGERPTPTPVIEGGKHSKKTRKEKIQGSALSPWILPCLRQAHLCSLQFCGTLHPFVI